MTFLLSPAEAIIQFSQDAIISTSLEGAIMTWNRGASKLYGYHDTEILGRPIQQLFSASTAALLPEILEQVLHGQTVEQLETTHLHQDGQPIEIALTASPIRSLLYEGIAFIIRDVTSRKKDEWKIQQLIEDLNDLHRVDRELGYTLNIDRILSLAMDMVIRRSDATGATIAWIKESTQTLEPLKSLGKTTWLTEPLPLSAVLKRQDELGDAFRKTVLYIYPPRKDTHSDLFIPLFLRKEAQGVLILEQISPFSETDIGFLIQIAGRLALAIEKAWLFSHLSALEAIKSEMLQMASHDLRNPLAQIMGYADILASTLENNAGDQQQYLANIMRAATHMNELLEDILSLERIQQVAWECQELCVTRIPA